MASPHVTDPLLADLLGVYERGHARLAATVRAGLARGLDPERIGTPDQRAGDATLAYRQRQREQAAAILAELRAQTTRAGPLAIGAAYRSGLVATDRTVGDALTIRGQFGRVHVRAVEALAGNMTQALNAAIARTGDNVAAVFDRADALDGALPAGSRGQPTAATRFIGRRLDDPYRKVALEEVAQGVVGLATRREVSAALRQRLITEGVTDAVTGFVDRAGRRWPLPAYAAMVARTTTREAMSAATANRLIENGLGYVTVSSHPHRADECSPYDGQTFALPDAPNPEGLDVLDQLPPFHPNCGHVIGPADVNLDAYERELERAVAAGGKDAEPTDPPPPVAPTRPTTPEGKLQALIDTERAASVDRRIEAITGYSPADVAARRARHAAEGFTPPGYVTAAYAKVDELAARAAAGDPDLNGLDHAGVMAVGKAVRQLVDRRVKAGLKRIEADLAAAQRDTVALSDELAAVRERLMAGAANPVEVYRAAIEHPDYLAVKVRRDEAARRGDDARARRDALDRDVMRDVLSKVRPGFGEGRLDPARHAITSARQYRQDAEDALRDALRCLPREWVEQSDAAGVLNTAVTAERGARGWHRWEGGDSTMSIPVRGGRVDRGTTLHELAHRLEQAVRGMRQAEYDFYARRTTVRRGRRAGELEEAQRLRDLIPGSGYRPNERTREDRWGPSRLYAGKAYGRGSSEAMQPGTYEGAAYEVLTMGLQDLWVDRHRGPLDDDYREWLLGLLAGL